MTDSSAGITIIYDGDCPFCSAYVRMVRLKEAVEPVRLIDARSRQDLVRGLRAQGFDLDRGMVVQMDGTTYHGAKAMHVLSLMTTRLGAFNRLVRPAFSNPKVARAIYPVLVAGRNAVLFVLGRGRINPGG